MIFDEYLERDELAAMLGKRPATLAGWATNHIGPPVVKIGGSPFYAKAAVLTWISQQQRKAVKLRSSK